MRTQKKFPLLGEPYLDAVLNFFLVFALFSVRCCGGIHCGKKAPKKKRNYRKKINHGRTAHAHLIVFLRRVVVFFKGESGEFKSSLCGTLEAPTFYNSSSRYLLTSKVRNSKCCRIQQLSPPMPNWIRLHRPDRPPTVGRNLMEIPNKPSTALVVTPPTPSFVTTTTTVYLSLAISVRIVEDIGPEEGRFGTCP